jgi:hypothetical protein
MRSWVDIKASSCALQTWVRRLIEGKGLGNELHGILCHEDLEPLNSEEERMMIYLTFGPTSAKFNYKHFGHLINEEVIETEIKTSRSGRRIKEPSKKYIEWDGESIRRGSLEELLDCVEGNPRIRELMDRVRKSLKTAREPRARSHTVAADSGRIRIELKSTDRFNKKIRARLEACRDEEDLRTFLREEKLWRVTFKEDEDREDLVPGQGWCGYLAIDQVRRQSDLVGGMNQEGIQHLKETLDEIINCSVGGIRSHWRDLGSEELTTREVLLSVKDTLTNWRAGLKDSLEEARWLNARNIYGTCGRWDYSQWGEDPEDTNYCELRDSYATQGSVTNLEEWRWALNRSMVVGTRGHYYVRKGGLIDDFETAFQEAIGRAATELRHLMAAHGSGDARKVTSNAVNNDVPVGYNDGFCEALRLNGREISTVAGDGYCLFHAVAVGLGRQGEGMEVHKEVLAVLENRKEELREFVIGTV